MGSDLVHHIIIYTLADSRRSCYNRRVSRFL